jgi:hypothetical protein
VRTDAAVRGPLLTVCLAAGLLLTACTGQPSAAGGSSSATASPSNAADPSSAPAPSASAATTGPAGCSNGTTQLPDGADTASIGDVDGDGKADTAFFAEASSGFEYGIRTAAGGVVTLKDDLAGPGRHSGWTATLGEPGVAVTVLDDGRTATLHAFAGCRFVPTIGADGEPYRFGLNGFSEAGTGVACDDRSGVRELQGVLAKRRADGRYDIRWTRIDVSADGTRATNGPTQTRWTGLAGGDARVRAAMGSSCAGAPKVGTSGR